MYAELYQYLLLHNKLSVPGIGTFLLQRKPAQSDFVNRQMKSPVYSIFLTQATETSSKNFFGWLANALAITDREAIIRFNDFAFDIYQRLTADDSIQWNGVGTLNKGLAGEVKLTAATAFSPETPVAAEKVIREKAEHMVRVGEEERSSTEMTAALTKAVTKKSYWWIPALIITVLAIGFIAWYFYTNGMDISSTGNNMRLIPEETEVVSGIAQ
jgi:hypothetical protein